MEDSLAFRERRWLLVAGVCGGRKVALFLTGLPHMTVPAQPSPGPLGPLLFPDVWRTPASGLSPSLLPLSAALFFKIPVWLTPPLPTGPFLSGFLVQLFKKRRRELSGTNLWGFLATVTSPCKVNNKVLVKEQTPQSSLLVT